MRCWMGLGSRCAAGWAVLCWMAWAWLGSSRLPCMACCGVVKQARRRLCMLSRSPKCFAPTRLSLQAGARGRVAACRAAGCLQRGDGRRHVAAGGAARRPVATPGQGACAGLGGWGQGVVVFPASFEGGLAVGGNS